MSGTICVFVKCDISFPGNTQEEFTEKTRRLQHTITRTWDVLLRFNMYVLNQYRYTDEESKRTTAELEEDASSEAKEKSKQDLEALQKSLAWVLYVLADEERKKSTAPRYVLLRFDTAHIWGWSHTDMTLLFEVWADFGGLLRRTDITSIEVEAEKISYTERYGRIIAIFEDFLETGLEEHGYKVI